jgi:CII-binding regulator of phage lambda lysogenization HflD
MFGMGATVNEQAFSGAQTLVDVIGLIAEPDRKRLTEQLRQLHEALKKIDAARTELSRVEARLLERENQASAAEAALAKRSADLDERQQQVQAMQMRAEQGIAELAALKADLKSKMAA